MCSLSRRNRTINKPILKYETTWSGLPIANAKEIYVLRVMLYDANLKKEEITSFNCIVLNCILVNVKLRIPTDCFYFDINLISLYRRYQTLSAFTHLRALYHQIISFLRQIRFIVSESYQFDLGPNIIGSDKGKGEQTIVTSGFALPNCVKSDRKFQHIRDTCALNNVILSDPIPIDAEVGCARLTIRISIQRLEGATYLFADPPFLGLSRY